jgi:methyltransferase (TIGR00027 family)
VKPDQPSATAAFVAACRGCGALLPAGARLVDDPLGLRFAGALPPGLADAVRGARGPARLAAQAAMLPALGWVVDLQVRTRAIDEALRGFVAGGGAQVVLLGAGYDTRPVRLADALDAAAVFEVDHPPTQRRKRAVLAAAGAPSTARYLPWDFERDPLARLPSRLAALGHDPSRPTFTVWEGVTMYLSADALDDSVAAIASYSAPRSPLAFNYVRRDVVDSPRPLTRLAARLVGAVGEPVRSGLDPAALPAWLGGRGFALRRDDALPDLARRWLPEPWGRLTREGRRLAVAERS